MTNVTIFFTIWFSVKSLALGVKVIHVRDLAFLLVYLRSHRKIGGLHLYVFAM